MLNKSVTTVVRLFLALWLAITPTFVWAGSMSLLGVGGPAAGGGAYTAQGVHFSSAAPQGLQRGAALTGVSNSTVGLLSFWFRAEGADANTFRILSDNASHFLLDRLGTGNTGKVRLIVTDSVGSQLINVISTSTVFTASNGNWHHFLASWTTSGTTSYTLYVDGVLDNSSGGNTGTIGYATSVTDWFLPNPGLAMDADIADFWFDTGIAFPAQLDLSVAGNRQKFISGGNPVNLGTDGSTPSGTKPPVFLSGAVASWNTNKGSGGGFTLNSGPLTSASSNPP